jgi:hypothetical protein
MRLDTLVILEVCIDTLSVLKLCLHMLPVLLLFNAFLVFV